MEILTDLLKAETAHRQTASIGYGLTVAVVRQFSQIAL
jgi:hypothetical protein